MPALSLDELAVVLAHVSHYPADDTARVLAELEVSTQEFLDAANTHPAAIADEMGKGSADASARFQASYDETLKQLAANTPKIDQLTPLRAALHAAPRPVDPAMDATLDPLTGSPVAPTPFRPGPAMAVAPIAPRLPSESGDTAGLDAAPSEALPFEQHDFSHWALETYASFTAERRWLDADTVRLRYGLRDGADEYALMIHFNRRFANEAGLRERWTELVQRRARELNRGG